MSIPDTLYVVMGTDRDYSCGDLWCVAAYADEQAATQHARLAQADANAFEAAADEQGISRSELVENWDFVWDRTNMWEYPGHTEYYVVAVPHRLHPDEYLERPAVSIHHSLSGEEENTEE